MHLERTTAWDPNRHVLDRYRPLEPLKALVFPPRETLGPVFQAVQPADLTPRVVIGVKNCDLSALAIHDFVFLKNEPVDPYYARLREQTLIVSCDCTDCRESCFCPAVGEQPYPKAGFDVNLSVLENGCVVEPGSERGQALIASFKPALAAPADERLRQRDQNRQALYHRVAGQAESRGLRPGQDLRQAVVKTEEADFWKEFAADCVECGACNYICCTCHCFLLRDGRSSDQAPGRLKQWDSCLHKNFARVAGGANPRAHRTERLYNRFDKKFNFFPALLGRYACDGCGRCAEACTGRIDIRDVLRKALA
ncbi:MAG: 4Fe-4S dicluster domain-containing protein [candidate division FCPU426 bacterium]